MRPVCEFLLSTVCTYCVGTNLNLVRVVHTVGTVCV